MADSDPALKDGYLELPPGKLATVVTTLEMLAKAPPAPEPASIPWTLKFVGQADPGWYRELFRRVGEEWLWFSRLRMSDAELNAITHDPAVEIYALVHAGREEGLLELDFRSQRSCELAFFGVTAAVRGMGAGRWLMNRAAERAWSRPISRFWVHTCTLDHPAALAFYRKSGFVPVGRQLEIADDPRLTGVHPTTAAPQIPLL